jgi:hypothetical protein
MNGPTDGASFARKVRYSLIETCGIDSGTAGFLVEIYTTLLESEEAAGSEPDAVARQIKEARDRIKRGDVPHDAKFSPLYTAPQVKPRWSGGKPVARRLPRLIREHPSQQTFAELPTARQERIRLAALQARGVLPVAPAGVVPTPRRTNVWMITIQDRAQLYAPRKFKIHRQLQPDAEYRARGLFSRATRVNCLDQVVVEAALLGVADDTLLGVCCICGQTHHLDESGLCFKCRQPTRHHWGGVPLELRTRFGLRQVQIRELCARYFETIAKDRRAGYPVGITADFIAEREGLKSVEQMA